MSRYDNPRFYGCTIPLSEDFRVKKMDDLNWALQCRRIPKEGKDKGVVLWDNFSYHQDLGSACLYAAQRLADEAVDIDALATYADRLKRIGDEIAETVNAYVQTAPGK